MKTIFCLFALVASAAAFAPVMRPANNKMSALRMSEPAEDEEEGGLDLDLGEMFEVFEAAEKGQNFDAAMKNVKKDE